METVTIWKASKKRKDESENEYFLRCFYENMNAVPSHGSWEEEVIKKFASFFKLNKPQAKGDKP